MLTGYSQTLAHVLVHFLANFGYYCWLCLASFSTVFGIIFQLFLKICSSFWDFRLLFGLFSSVRSRIGPANKSFKINLEIAKTQARVTRVTRWQFFIYTSVSLRGLLLIRCLSFCNIFVPFLERIVTWSPLFPCHLVTLVTLSPLSPCHLVTLVTLSPLSPCHFFFLVLFFPACASPLSRPHFVHPCHLSCIFLFPRAVGMFPRHPWHPCHPITDTHARGQVCKKPRVRGQVADKSDLGRLWAYNFWNILLYKKKTDNYANTDY